MTTQAFTVCHLTTGHSAVDTRIFGKEATSLARSGYRVTVIGEHERSECVEGVRIVPVPPAKHRFTRFFANTWRLARLALRENADVYHFHDPELIPLGALLKLRSKKVVYDVHEDYEQVLLSRDWIPKWLRRPLAAVWWQFEKRLAGCFDAMLTRDSALRDKFPPHKSEAIRNVPPRRIFRDDVVTPPSDKFRVVQLTTSHDKKGVRGLLEVLARLRTPDVELNLIGSIADPELQAALQNDPHVVCHGRLPWDRLTAVLERSHVGLLLFPPTPAHLTLTGEGNTRIFEFMGVGLPVLYSDFPLLRGFMEGIGAGYPVDPTQPDKVAEAIDYLAQHPELRRQMSQAGRKAVRERFHWEKEEETLLAVYSRLLPRGVDDSARGAASNAETDDPKGLT